MVALPGGAHVLRAAALAERLQHRGDRRGALGGQVAADPPGPVEGGVQAQAPVAEPAAAGVFVGVGLLGAPGLVGGLREDLQVVQIRARRRGVDQDPVGLGLQFLVVDAAGPGGDLPRPRDGDGARGGGGVEEGVAGEEPHLADGGLGVLAAEVVFRGQPGGGAGVPVGVVAVVGVEPPQQPVGGRAEQGGDGAEGLQRLAPGGALEVGGGRGVQVPGDGVADAERVRHAREAPAGGGQGATGTVCRAHRGPPPPRRVPRGWRAGRPPRMRLLRLTHAGLPASPYRLPVRPTIIKGYFHDHLFDFLSPTPSTGNRGRIESAGSVRENGLDLPGHPRPRPRRSFRRALPRDRNPVDQGDQARLVEEIGGADRRSRRT